MRLAWVGGVEKSERILESIAADAGWEMEFHGGHVGGRGEEKLRAAVARADLVLIVTDVNSHGAVGVAKKEAHRLGREVLVVRRFGPAKLKQLLVERAPRLAS
jgi:hypothetical protein